MNRNVALIDVLIRVAKFAVSQLEALKRLQEQQDK